MAAQIDATMWALYGWHGVHPGLRHAKFWGLPQGRVERSARKVFDAILQRRRFNAFDLTDERVASFFDELLAFQPRYVHGYPSLVDEFARVAADRALDGRDLGVQVVFLTGEMLSERVRDRVSNFFDARVVNEYGCSESGLLAFDCEMGGCHLIPSAAFLEVLNSQCHRISDHGTGEGVVTDLYGSHLPLLRYRLGDRIRVRGSGSCPCGRSLPLVDVSAGRTSSFIRLPDSRRVYAAAIAYAMPPEVDRFQARQTSLSQLALQIQVKPGQPPVEIREVCRRNLQDTLDRQLNIAVTVVDRVPQGPGGKLRYFIPLSESVRDDSA